MILNIVWLCFFFAAFLACLVQWLAFGDAGIFSRVLQESFRQAQLLQERLRLDYRA